MTNGEKMIEIFPNIQIFNVTENELKEKFIYIRLGDVCQAIELEWWNAEYKEPTTKNDLGVDCISRDSAIKALDYDIKSFDFKSGVSEHMDDIARLLNTIYEIQVNNIKAMPPVIPQEPRWIPVSERLPEDYETVIASNGHEYVYPEARYSKEYGWEWAYESGMDYWEDLIGVDAWMPLPEPYKAEIKTVANAEEAEAHPINENIAKGFEEFTKMMFRQGQAEREEER